MSESKTVCMSAIVSVDHAKAISAVPELIAVLQEVYEEFCDRYDGAPDSKTQWMGSLMHTIEEALKKAGVL